MRASYLSPRHLSCLAVRALWQLQERPLSGVGLGIILRQIPGIHQPRGDVKHGREPGKRPKEAALGPERQIAREPEEQYANGMKARPCDASAGWIGDRALREWLWVVIVHRSIR